MPDHDDPVAEVSVQTKLNGYAYVVFPVEVKTGRVVGVHEARIPLSKFLAQWCHDRELASRR